MTQHNTAAREGPRIPWSSSMSPRHRQKDSHCRHTGTQEARHPDGSQEDREQTRCPRNSMPSHCGVPEPSAAISMSTTNSNAKGDDSWPQWACDRKPDRAKRLPHSPELCRGNAKAKSTTTATRHVLARGTAMACIWKTQVQPGSAGWHRAVGTHGEG